MITKPLYDWVIDCFIEATDTRRFNLNDSVSEAEWGYLLNNFRRQLSGEQSTQKSQTGTGEENQVREDLPQTEEGGEATKETGKKTRFDFECRACKTKWIGVTKWANCPRCYELNEHVEWLQGDIPKRSRDEEIAELRAEVEQLQAIVDKSPKTADNVSVVEGDYVFMVIDGVVLRRQTRVVYGGLGASTGYVENCPSTLNYSVDVPVSKCYSTREAAEKAMKQEGKSDDQH